MRLSVKHTRRTSYGLRQQKIEKQQVRIMQYWKHPVSLFYNKHVDRLLCRDDIRVNIVWDVRYDN